MLSLGNSGFTVKVFEFIRLSKATWRGEKYAHCNVIVRVSVMLVINSSATWYYEILPET